MRSQPLPLLLLAGFLGSGKTSTLRHWLETTDLSLRKVAVVINDFGEINVDAALLARRQLELRSITGGCVCCQSFDDLVGQLALLAENPEIELVWIETSGLADPEEVLDHLSEPSLQGKTRVQRMILVLDGSDFPCSWRGQKVQEEQIRYADLILINKMDLLDAKAQQRLEAKIGEINPRAAIHLVERGRIAPTLLSSGLEEDRISLPAVNENHHDHESHHDHGGKDDPLPHSAATYFLPFPKPLHRRDFESLLAALPREVFRAKGFVRFTESPDQIHTFQKVRDQSELIVLPLEGRENLSEGLVVIGPQLDEGCLRSLEKILPSDASTL